MMKVEVNQKMMTEYLVYAKIYCSKKSLSGQVKLFIVIWLRLLVMKSIAI
jgi:hypothetical protein